MSKLIMMRGLRLAFQMDASEGAFVIPSPYHMSLLTLKCLVPNELASFKHLNSRVDD